jgi:tetratricopeptide (TPR) repeat protein
MYQVRITKWGIDKKLKAGEVQHALRKIDSRRRMGKETEISIRGTIFSEQRLRRYVERSHLIPEEATLSEAVTALTPPPEVVSPSAGWSAAGSSSNTPRSLATEVETPLLSPNFVYDSISPDALHPSSESSTRSITMSSLRSRSPSRQAESSSNALTYIDHYYNRYWDARWWTPWPKEDIGFDLPQGPGYPSAVPDQCLGMYSITSKQADPAFVIYSVQNSCELFRAGSDKYPRARRCLGQAHSQIKTLLLEQAPLLLPCLLSAVSLLDLLREEMQLDDDQQSSLRLFLKFVSGMAETKLGSAHEITQLFLSLVELRNGHHQMAQTAMQRIAETFRGKLDPQHPYHFRLVCNHAWILIWRRQFDEARGALENFPYSIAFRPYDDDPQYRESRYLLAQIYIALHRLDEAARCFHEIIERAKEGLGEERAHLVTFDAWRMLAVMADFQQDFDARSRWENEAVNCGEMAFGPHDYRVLRLQRVMAGLEPRDAPAHQWRFTCSFPPVED